MKAYACLLFAMNFLAWGLLTLFAASFFFGIRPDERFGFGFVFLMAAVPPMVFAATLLNLFSLRHSFNRFVSINCILAVAALFGVPLYLSQYLIGV